jgi:hypothetical protein
MQLLIPSNGVYTLTKTRVSQCHQFLKTFKTRFQKINPLTKRKEPLVIDIAIGEISTVT